MRFVFFPVVFFIASILLSCAPYHAVWNSGWTEKDANNSVMLVIEKPQTLGWKRLQYHSTLHPEFSDFLSLLGTPDCIAETTQSQRHYLILYYLKKRQAYSFRNDTRRISRPAEVSGPYPISDKEYRLLSEFQNKAYQSLGMR